MKKLWQLQVAGFATGEDKTKVTEIVIPSKIEKNGKTYTITTIANNAFDNTDGKFSNLKGDLVIPNTIVSIGDKAFYNCDFKGAKLTLSQNLIHIGVSAFEQSAEANKVGFSGNLIIPDNVLTISDNAFRNILFDGYLKLSKNLKTIGSFAFAKSEFKPREKKFKGNLVIPNSVETISRNAFLSAGFDGGLKLSENEKYTTVTVGCFQNCNFTSLVAIPKNISSIEGYGFYGSFTKLKGLIEIPKTVTKVGSVALKVLSAPSGKISIYNTTSLDTNSLDGWKGNIIIY